MRNIAAAGIICLFLANVSCLGSSGSDCAGSCHNTPPVTGAHLSHTDGLLPMPCDSCHGEGASDSDHPGHENGSLTVLGQDDYEADHGSLPAWYSSVWGSAAAFDGTDPSSSICSGLTCHGLDPVGWTQDMRSAVYNPICKSCHDLTPAVFQLPGYGTIFQASTAAANYEGPISGFGRGGHGDTRIGTTKDSGHPWFHDTAPGSSVPLVCITCHDADVPHFPVADDNPYRMPAAALANNLPGASLTVGPVTNLCTQTDCHPKVLGNGDFGFLTPLKHPNDDWPLTYPNTTQVNSPQAQVNSEALSSSSDPAFDPAARIEYVGLNIDRYVDHWAYWNTSVPATTGSADDEPFLPLGDPLFKHSGDVFDNDASIASRVVVCITCHNPHGTDLYVQGKTPGVPDAQVMVPDNRMLRLRNANNELCDGCHM